MVVVAGGVSFVLLGQNNIPGSTGGYVTGSSATYENQALDCKQSGNFASAQLRIIEQ